MSTPDTKPTFQVGAAVVDVYPPPGTRMAGFAARAALSTGVHDPVSVRALAVDRTCLITVDSCGLHEMTCEQIARALPLPVENVAVTATHTHAGPCVTPGRLGGHDEKVLDEVIAAAVAAGEKAIAGQQPAELFYREAAGIGVASNRRHTGRTIDPAAQLASFHRPDGRPVAWVLLYPCHPVVAGPANRLISGDYPAFARKSLEAAAPGSTAFFLPGAPGDVNTGHSAEASYSLGEEARRTLEEAERIGELVAQQALRGPVQQMQAVLARSRTSVRKRTVSLRLEPLDRHSPQELAAQWSVEERTADPSRRALLKAWIEWAERRTSSPEQLVWPAPVSVMRWGSLTIVALPGEPFLQTAEAIAAEIGGTVMVTGYTNGCPGYLPPQDEYEFGGYEVIDAHRYYGMPAPFARGSAEELARAAVDLASHP